MDKQNQLLLRLRAVAATVAGLVVLAVAWPAAAGNPAAQAAPPIPQSNPYSNPTQCVYGAWLFAAEAGHKLPYFGVAKNWRQAAIDYGYEVVDTIDPSVVHSVAVWGAGVGGVSWAGHVGWVLDVQGDRFLVRDRNWIPARDYEHWVTWQAGISFIKLGEPESPEPTPTAAPPTATPEPPTPTPTSPPPATPAAATGRRVTDSPASRSPRRPAAAVRSLSARTGAAPSPVPWPLQTTQSIAHLLGLPARGAEPARPLGPLRWLAPGAGEPAMPAVDELLPFNTPSLWPQPTDDGPPRP